MKRAGFLSLLLLGLTGCPKEEALTTSEARLALDEAGSASSAEVLVGASVDISTNFTLGQAAADAAAELGEFIASQLPCAEVTLEKAKLTIEYGVNPGSCSYRGQEFSGTHSISVAQAEAGQVIVDHEWQAFSNGLVQVDGSAHVTWDFDEQTRRVEHETTWVDLRSGRTGEGSGDRTQSLLPGGLAEGIQVDGSRSWEGERGHWGLSLDGVQMRWSDPVPQAGSFTLVTPFDKTVHMSFARVDEDTIGVTVAGPNKKFTFNVSKFGTVEEQ